MPSYNTILNYFTLQSIIQRILHVKLDVLSFWVKHRIFCSYLMKQRMRIHAYSKDFNFREAMHVLIKQYGFDNVYTVLFLQDGRMDKT